MKFFRERLFNAARILAGVLIFSGMLALATPLVLSVGYYISLYASEGFEFSNEKRQGNSPRLPSDAELAQKIREEAPWRIPDDIFNNYVLPQTSIGEDVDDWRPIFNEKFRPLVSDCKTPTAAAEKLNREIWNLLGVHYNTERDKPDQSPFHSIRTGKASCTGLSILLIDACRSVGVPARFVGCRWKNKPGNHSWVEIWDNGEWKHLGAGDGGNAGHAWFDADAAEADPDDPRFSIYAACATPTGTFFPEFWRGSDAPSNIPAINVSEHYRAFAKKTPKDHTRVFFDFLDKSGTRIEKTIVIFDDKTGELLAAGNTRDAHSDLNDHLEFAFPRGKELRIAIANPDGSFCPLGKIVVPAERKLFKLETSDR